MTDDILPTILKNTFTILQLNRRIRILKIHLLKAIFGGSKEQVLTPSDLEWLGSLPQNFLKNFNKDNIYPTLDTVEREISQLPTITIYLPFTSSENISLQIGSYARKAYSNTKLLLEIRYDPSLIAGAALSWRGMYRDYSLRAKIEEKKEELLAGFKKYLK